MAAVIALIEALPDPSDITGDEASLIDPEELYGKLNDIYDAMDALTTEQYEEIMEMECGGKLEDVGMRFMDVYGDEFFGGAMVLASTSATTTCTYEYKNVTLTYNVYYDDTGAPSYVEVGDNRSCTYSIVVIPSEISIELTSDNGSTTKYEHVPVTGIADQAFIMCDALTEVTIPGSVISIGTESFESKSFACCPNLKKLTIEEGVQKIGYYAFWGCKKLEEVTIPNTVTLIDWCAFYQCENLIKVNSDVDGIVNIPKGVETIGPSAFDSCKAITTVMIPSTVTKIESTAFSQCSKLNNVTFAEDSKLTVIGARAFYLCALDMIVIPSSVTKIENNAFWRCESLQTVDFGANSDLEIIGDDAFSACKSLSCITIPASVTSIGYEAFSGCSGLEDVTFTEGSQLNSLGAYAFKNCTELETITLPDSLTTLNLTAFSGCKDLTDIVADKVNTIESYDDQWHRPDDNLIGNGSQLSSVELNGLDATGDNNDNLTILKSLLNKTPVNTVSLDSLTVITDPADSSKSIFTGNTNLTTIEIPSVTTLTGNEFTGCTNLTTVDISGVGTDPDSDNKTLPGSAFKDLNNLTTVTLSDEITAIGDYAFSGCNNLSSVAFKSTDDTETANAGIITLPDTVTSIGIGSFKDCEKITGIELPDSVKSIPEAAFSGSGLKSFTINYGVTNIGANAFADCTGLTSIVIPVTVKAGSIAANAFQNCSLTSITCPCTYANTGLFESSGIDPESQTTGFWQEHNATATSDTSTGSDTTGGADGTVTTASAATDETGNALSTAATFSRASSLSATAPSSGVTLSSGPSDLVPIVDGTDGTGADSTSDSTDSTTNGDDRTHGEFNMVHDWVWENTTNTAVLVAKDCGGHHFDSSTVKCRLEIKIKDTSEDGVLYKAYIVSGPASASSYLIAGNNIPSDEDIKYSYGSRFDGSTQTGGISKTDTTNYYYAYIEMDGGKDSAGNAITVTAYKKQINYNGPHSWIWQVDPDDHTSLIAKNCSEVTNGHFAEEAENNFIQCQLQLVLDKSHSADGYYTANVDKTVADDSYNVTVPEVKITKDSITGAEIADKKMKKTEPGIYYASMTSNNGTSGSSVTAYVMYEIDSKGNITQGHQWVWENTDHSNVLIAYDCDLGHFADEAAKGIKQCQIEIKLNEVDNPASDTHYTCYLDTTGTKAANLEDMELPEIVYTIVSSFGYGTHPEYMTGEDTDTFARTYEVSITTDCGKATKYGALTDTGGVRGYIKYRFYKGKLFDPDPDTTIDGSVDTTDNNTTTNNATTNNPTDNTAGNAVPSATVTADTSSTTSGSGNASSGHASGQKAPQTYAISDTEDTEADDTDSSKKTANKSKRRSKSSNDDTDDPGVEISRADGALADGTDSGDDGPVGEVAGVIKDIVSELNEKGIIVTYEYIILILVIAGVITLAYKIVKKKKDDKQ